MLLLLAVTLYMCYNLSTPYVGLCAPIEHNDLPPAVLPTAVPRKQTSLRRDSNGACLYGGSGQVALDIREQSSWERAVSSCTERCKRCHGCHYVSVSLRWRSCSWFHRCDLNALTRNASLGFRSAMQVDLQRWAHAHSIVRHPLQQMGT